MARIEYIKRRLENWARWCAQSESGSLGFPKQSNFVRYIVPSGPAESSVPVAALDASEIDDAVRALQFRQSHLYLVLTLTYVKGLPRHRVATHMGRAESTISANLEAADRAIDRWLEDRRHAQAEAKRSLST